MSNKATLEIHPGMRFGKLCVVEKSPERGRGVIWICACECGQQTLKYSGYLRNGAAKSCGCIVGGRANRTHGMSFTPEYKAWDNARSRCYRENDRKYPLYGGRGIRMCDSWRGSFAAFFSDMGKRPSAAHSLDRKNGEGDYCPENCRWATAVEQNNNRSLNRRLNFAGHSVTVAEASRAAGIPHATILSRLDAGKSDEEATRRG